MYRWGLILSSWIWRSLGLLGFSVHDGDYFLRLSNQNNMQGRELILTLGVPSLLTSAWKLRLLILRICSLKDRRNEIYTLVAETSQYLSRPGLLDDHFPNEPPCSTVSYTPAFTVTPWPIPKRVPPDWHFLPSKESFPVLLSPELFSGVILLSLACKMTLLYTTIEIAVFAAIATVHWHLSLRGDLSLQE